MLYANIKQISKQKGIPIYKIEQELDIARGSICKWDSVSPAVEKVAGVAKVLGTTVEDLLEEKEG